MIQLVTDSCNDLPQELIEKYNIHIVPMQLTVDGEQYKPGEDISVEEALNKIAAAKAMPSTSQPPPAAYEAIFNQLQSEGPIICFTISSLLSGSFNSASLAAKNCGREIYVHDTLQGSCGQGFQILLAATMIEEGKSVPQILDALQKYYKESSMVVVLEKYDNAIKGGRVNKVAGAIVQKLNIKAIIEVLDGKVIIVDKARGAEKTMQKMLERISSKKADFSQTIVGIADFNRKEKAKEYKDKIMALVKPKEFYFSSINPTIGVYCDEGGLVISIAPCPFSFGR